MSVPPAAGSGGGERIPFWRNVKLIGLLTQVIFVLVLVAGFSVIAINVSTALTRANLPADFSWMSSRAGIPIAETPIRYSPADPYWRAILVGLINTLKVALIGVVLASLIGIGVGVMRLSSNFLVRTIATIYIELLRNIPLAVQIVFWYTAVLLPVPPRVNNAIELPGGALLSNVGLAIPWLYPGDRFGAWWPWLVVAVVAAIVGGIWRARAAQASEVPLRVWPVPVALLLGITAVGYGVASIGSGVPTGAAVDFNDERARGVVFLDFDGNGRKSPDEPFVSYASTVIRLSEGELRASSQNLTESRREVPSSFRFPRLLASEYSDVRVEFVDEDAANEAGYRLHFKDFPWRGAVYVDLDGDGAYTPGEDVNPATGVGYGGVELIMTVTGFERAVVADRDGQVRTPSFAPVGSARQEQVEAEQPATPQRGLSIFAPVGAPAATSAEALVPIDYAIELRPTGPLVLSRVHTPVSGYEGGQRFTVNYLALLFALVIYTSAFIGEIVRGGIQAVAKGQREAAMALGLSDGQVFSLVVFPQALRVVLPPMISQFLNLTKNSSLAPLAAYGELFVIATIAANQSGASVPIALLLIVSYLGISLTFALVLNVVNDRFALVER
jgi:general L-amino acid transport system permease protein